MPDEVGASCPRKTAAEKQVQAALDSYFGFEPTPAEAFEFLVRLRHDVNIMIAMIRTKL